MFWKTFRSLQTSKQHIGPTMPCLIFRICQGWKRRGAKIPPRLVGGLCLLVVWEKGRWIEQSSSENMEYELSITTILFDSIYLAKDFACSNHWSRFTIGWSIQSICCSAEAFIQRGVRLLDLRILAKTFCPGCHPELDTHMGWIKKKIEWWHTQIQLIYCNWLSYIWTGPCRPFFCL